MTNVKSIYGHENNFPTINSCQFIHRTWGGVFSREPIDLSNEEWRSLLRNEALITKTDENAEPVEKIVCFDSDSKEECVDAEPAQPKITSLSEAIEMLNDLAKFAERRLQDESLVSSLNKVCSAIQNLRIQNFRQKRISDYFGTTSGVHS